MFWLSLSALRGNGGYGLHLVDSSARVLGSTFGNNRSGSAASELGASLELAGERNVLDRPASGL